MKYLKLSFVLVTILMVLLAACAAPTPEVIEKEVVVEKPVVETVVVEKEVVVEKPVVETVVVKEEVVVEKPVVETVIVEKEVVVEKVVKETVVVEKAAEPKSLVVAIEGDVETLDPNFSRYPTANMINLNVYEQFFRYGVDDTGEGYFVTNVGEIEPAAIESWEVADDRMSVAMHIREGVRFPKTGNEMTADDIMYWYEKGLETKSGILWNLETANISSFEKTGKYAVVVNFSQPLNLFFMLARDQCWGVVDSVEAQKHATDDDPWANEWLAKNYSGAGEYIVESWDPGVQMVLAANEDYWAGKPYFDKIIFRVIPDSSNRAALIQRGGVDVTLGLSPDQINELRDSADVNVLSIPSRTEVVVILNCSLPPFDNKLVRKAVSYLVPYDQIINDIYEGRALPAGSVIPVLGQNYNPEFWEYEYNVEKAKELLAEAGLPDGFEFALNIKEGEEISSILAVTLQSAFKQAGVSLKIKEVTNAIWAEGMAAGTHEATLWSVGYLSYIDDPWYKLRGFKSGSVTNRPRYSHPRIDELYEELQVVFEPNERQALADEMQEILVDDAPFLWLANVPIEYVTRSDIKGFTFMQDSLLWFYPLYREE